MRKFLASGVLLVSLFLSGTAVANAATQSHTAWRQTPAADTSSSTATKTKTDNSGKLGLLGLLGLAGLGGLAGLKRRDDHDDARRGTGAVRRDPDNPRTDLP